MTFNDTHPSGYAWLASPDGEKWACGGIHRGTLPTDLNYQSWDRDLSGGTPVRIPTLAVDHWVAYEPTTGETHTLSGAGAGATTLGGVGALALPYGNWEFTAYAADGSQVGTGSRSLTPAGTGLWDLQAAGVPELIGAYTPCTVRHRLYQTEGSGPSTPVGFLADDGSPGLGWENGLLAPSQPPNTHALRARQSIASVIQGVDPGTPAEATALAACIAALPSTVRRFVVRNEPNSEPNRGGGTNPGPGGAAFISWALAVRDVVEAARTGASTHGPNWVTWGPKLYGQTEAYAGGGGFVRIKPAFHGYNANMARANLLRDMPRYNGLLRRESDNGAGGYYTLDDMVWDEAGGFTAANTGHGTPWMQLRHFILALMSLEQFGVLANNVAPFYGQFRGHPDHFSYFVEEHGNPYPVVTALAWLCNVLLPAARAEVDGAPGRRGHDFGALDPWVAASTYRHPDETAWTWVQTDGIKQYDAVFRVTGGTPTTLPLHNYAGRQVASLTVSGGLVTVPMRMLPQYVHHPAGVSLEAVEPTRIDRTFGGTVSMSSSPRYLPGDNRTPPSPQAPLVAFTDARGADQSNLEGSTSYPMTTAAVTPSTPQWFRVLWTVPVQVEEAVFASPYPWEADNVAVLAASLQWLAPGADPANPASWQALTGTDGQPVALSYDPAPDTRITNQSGQGQLYRSWYVHDAVQPHALYGRWAKRSLQGIRYLATAAGRGVAPSQAALDAGPMVGLATPGAGLERIALWERGTTPQAPSTGDVTGFLPLAPPP